MDLKIYENFAPKCVIFESNFHKFSRKGTAPSPDPIPTLPPYSQFLDPPLDDADDN